MGNHFDLDTAEVIPLVVSLLDSGIAPDDIQADLEKVLKGMKIALDSVRTGVKVNATLIPTKTVIEPGYSGEDLILRGDMLKRGSEHTNLREKTKRMIKLLAESPGKLFTYEQLMEKLDFSTQDVYSTAMDIRRVMDKLKVLIPAVQTERSKGYRWNPALPLKVAVTTPA
jgi:DNA-binding response OmpR family regulator